MRTGKILCIKGRKNNPAKKSDLKRLDFLPQFFEEPLALSFLSVKRRFSSPLSLSRSSSFRCLSSGSLVPLLSRCSLLLFPQRRPLAAPGLQAPSSTGNLGLSLLAAPLLSILFHGKFTTLNSSLPSNGASRTSGSGLFLSDTLPLLSSEPTGESTTLALSPTTWQTGSTGSNIQVLTPGEPKIGHA